MKIVLNVLLCLLGLNLNAQHTYKLELEINYGLQGNFFVHSKDYTDEPNTFGTNYFNQKKPIGSIAGIELKYAIGPTSRFSIGFSQSVNRREVDFTGISIPVVIDDLKITHTNRFFEFNYERNWSKKVPDFKYHFGIFYMRSNQQEISIVDRRVQGGIEILERNYKSYGLEEGGISAGFQYVKKIDPHFLLGIKSRLYVTLSSGLEALTFTPTLSYQF